MKLYEELHSLHGLSMFCGPSQNLEIINTFLRNNVTQRELTRLFEGDIKSDILNSRYCSISKEQFDTKTIFILSY